MSRKRIKFLVRRNLKLSAEKMAAQCVHAALALNKTIPLDAMQSVVVLQISDKKFEEAKAEKPEHALIRDAGYTEVAPGTETCMAFLEDDPRCQNYE